MYLNGRRICSGSGAGFRSWRWFDAHEDEFSAQELQRTSIELRVIRAELEQGPLMPLVHESIFKMRLSIEVKRGG